MTPQAFARLRPELHHVAAPGAWRSILRDGLLSTTALLDLYGAAGAERHALEAQRRPEAAPLHHPAHGRAILRDQKPLNEKALAAQLTDGWTPEDWLRHLNRHVFLFPTRKAAFAFGDVYENRGDELLTFDTARVLDRAGDRARVCAINSGAPTARAPTARGPDTLREVELYARPPSTVREVAILNGLTGVAELLVRVERRIEPDRWGVIWRSGDPLPPPPPEA